MCMAIFLLDFSIICTFICGLVIIWLLAWHTYPSSSSVYNDITIVRSGVSCDSFSMMEAKTHKRLIIKNQHMNCWTLTYSYVSQFDSWAVLCVYCHVFQLFIINYQLSMFYVFVLEMLKEVWSATWIKKTFLFCYLKHTPREKMDRNQFLDRL